MQSNEYDCNMGSKTFSVSGCPIDNLNVTTILNISILARCMNKTTYAQKGNMSTMQMLPIQQQHFEVLSGYTQSMSSN